MARFVMAGGGTGGHVTPALAVARELDGRGHEVTFIGTRRGLESRLVPQAGFPIEWIEIGGLKRVGIARTLRTLAQLPSSVAAARAILRRLSPAALFSMGGYAAGPVVLAAISRRLPFVVMEPNAMPGLTNRLAGRWAARALLNFEEAGRYFRPGRSEFTGVPVREEFFQLPEKPFNGTLTLLITGGSRGSRRLNEAASQCWPLLKKARFPVRILHQTGLEAYEDIQREFRAAGLEGEVFPFASDMPGLFAAADLVLSRAGASAVSELAAAGKASILVPFPFAADNHQEMNAGAMERAGAARLVPDAEMSGDRLFRELRDLLRLPDELARMGRAARGRARPGAARRAAEILEETARGKG